MHLSSCGCVEERKTAFCIDFNNITVPTFSQVSAGSHRAFFESRVSCEMTLECVLIGWITANKHRQDVFPGQELVHVFVFVFVFV